MSRAFIILRHGPAAARHPGQADSARALTARGRRATEQAVAGLLRVMPRPELVLTSPALRAVQTAELLATAMLGGELLIEPSLASGGDAERLLARLAELDAESIALVGHEPDLSRFVARQCGFPDSTRLRLTKAGAAWLEVAPPYRAGTAVLRLLLTRRAARRTG